MSWDRLLSNVAIESWPCSTPTGQASSHETSYRDFLAANLPRGWTLDAPHIRLIVDARDRLARGEIDRLMVMMPPRHGKSETGAYRFGVYLLASRPSARVLVTAYNEQFARRFGRRLRNMAVGLGMPIDQDKQASDEWTMGDSLVMARGVGSPPTGSGFDVIDIDDPIRSRSDAESPAFRDRVMDWYTDDLMTRLEPGGAVCLTMTRWHHDDLAGHLLASEPGRWHVIRLPALAEDGDPLGRSVGAPLWPERFDAAALAEIRERMRREDGEYGWESLYQQNPTPRQGALFDVSRIEIVDVVPVGLRAVRGWDVAASSGKGDETAGVRIEGPDVAGCYYFTDVAHGQWGVSERDGRIRQTAGLDGHEVPQSLPQDPGAAGKAQAEAFVRLLAGYQVRTSPETGSKEVRAGPLASQVGAGNVRFLRAPWNAEVLEQFRQFPFGKRDDVVDAASRAFRELCRPAAWEPFAV